MPISNNAQHEKTNIRFIDFINGLEASNYECLIEKKMLSSIRSFSVSVPEFLTGLLEIRLDEKYSKVDFQICCSPSVVIPNDFVSEDFSSRLSSFCSEWNSPDSIVKKTKDFWLEFDANSDSSIRQAPSIFVNLPLKDSQDSITLAQCFLRNFGQIPEKSYIDKLEIYLSLLPKSSLIRYMGFLYSRPGQPLRIAIKGEGESLYNQLEYLAQIGWLQGQQSIRSFVYEQLAPIARLLKGYNVSFDFNQNGVFSRIGLDGCLHEPKNTSPEWDTILQYLVDRNLCSKDKKGALCEWSNSNKNHKLLNRGRSNFMREVICKPLKSSGAYYPRIEHIKLVFELPDIVEAKIYLFFGYS